MSRNSGGTYALPSSVNPVVSGTSITDEWANTTLDDIEAALTDSLDRQGRGGMTAALKITDGTVAAPGVSFTNESSTGFYRSAAGVMRCALLGAEVYRVEAAGITITGTLAVSGAITANLTGNVTGNVSGTAPAGSLTGATLAAGVTASSLTSIGTLGSLTVSGNVVLGDASTDTLNVGSGGIVKDASGNVGIATTSPTQLFQVGKFDRTGAMYQRISGQVADIYLGQGGSNLFGVSYLTTAYIFQDTANNCDLGIGTLGTNFLAFGTNNSERIRIDASGNTITTITASAPTLATNSQMVFSLTSNTNLRVSVRGTDGTTRVANLTLA